MPRHRVRATPDGQRPPCRPRAGGASSPTGPPTSDAFKNVSWGKAMMWIFLLSDTFIFGCFLHRPT